MDECVTPTCPQTLQTFSNTDIFNAFVHCYNRRSNLNVNKSNSLFGKVYTHLTGHKISSQQTRTYLHHIWTVDVKNHLQCNYKTKTAFLKSRQTLRQNTHSIPPEKRTSEQLHSDQPKKKIAFENQPNASTSKRNNTNIDSSHVEIPLNTPTPTQVRTRKEQVSEFISEAVSKVETLLLHSKKTNPAIINNTLSINSSTWNQQPSYTPRQMTTDIIKGVLSMDQHLLSPTKLPYTPLADFPKVPFNTPQRGPKRNPNYLKGMKDLAKAINDKLQLSKTQTRRFHHSEVSDSNPSIHNQSDDDEAEEIELQRIRQQIDRELQCYATFACTICRKKIQPTYKKRVRYTITPFMNTKFIELDCNDFQANDVIYVCLRCKANLDKKKIPPQAYFNNMAAPDAPFIISDLNEVESRLISQVKPFLKIFSLLKGRGQQAIRGSVIHFPQDITAVVQQLPLNASESDIIIVRECMEDTSKQFEVRPAAVYAALQFLKDYNPLYANVDVVQSFNRNVEHRNLNIGVAQNENPENIAREAQQATQGQVGFVSVTDCQFQRYILRASMHQGSSRFDEDHQGRQCTSMSAVVIAYAAYLDPNTWTTSTLNSILMRGDTYYGELIQRLHNNVYQYLVADEIAGVVTCFDESIQYEINPIALHMVNGVVNNFPDSQLEALPIHVMKQKTQAAIQSFLESAFLYAIFTTGYFSVAIIKTDDFTFIFDSHARGEKGCLTFDGNGLACITKFQNNHAAAGITWIIHLNLQTKAPYREGEFERFMFTLTPIHAQPFQNQHEEDQPYNFVEEDNVNVSSSPVQQPEALDPEIVVRCRVSQVPIIYTAPARMVSDNIFGAIANTIPPLNDINATLSHESNVQVSNGSTHAHENQNKDIPSYQNVIPQSVQQNHEEQFNFVEQHLINNIQLDCVVTADNFVQPQLENVISAFRQHQEFDLVREKYPPVYSDKQQRLEELSFIKCFPFGTHGLNEPRKIKITPLQYFQQRIMGSDVRFHSNEYLFYAVAEVERYTAQQKITICGNMRTEGEQHQNEEGDVQLPGLKNVHLYMSALRGSSSYWRKYKGDLCAMIEQLGTPTFFITFSYDDLNSIDAVTAIWKEMYGPDTEVPDPTDIPYEERKQALNNNPTAASRHFNHRMNVFMRAIQQHAVFLFGTEVVDWTYRIEFQQRGSPHTHSLFWLQDVPDWASPEGIQFIDKNVSCSLTVKYKDLVLRHQNHHHYKSCYRVPKVCRFAYPRPITSVTRVLDDADIEKNSGRFVDIKRTKQEIMINNYHPRLFRLLRCNMDIQPVTNSKSIAYYVGKYMSKAEPTILRDEIQKILNDIKGDSASANRHRALRICSKLMNQREICAQEGVFKLCHLPMRMSSRATVFMPAFPKDQRVRMIVKNSFTDESVKWGKNAIERYEQRPDTLQPLCLLEFMAYYQRAKPDSHEDLEQDLLEDADFDDIVLKPLEILLKDNTKMVKRTKAAIVKRPFFNPMEDSERYFYSLILAYFPFLNEDTLAELPSFRDAFIEMKRDNQFRTHADDPILRLEYAEAIDKAFAQALLLYDQEARMGDNDIHDDGDINLFEDPNDILTAGEAFPNNEANPEVNMDCINSRVHSLTAEQHRVYDMVFNKLNHPEDEPLRLFISGEGGTGKSYLLSTLKMLITLMTNSPESVLVGAITGVAALNIGGSTLHKLFSLGVERGAVGKYFELGGRKLEERRRLFRNVQWLFIDEISLLNYQLFRFIHLRLVQILNKDELFGGVNVILMGDLLQLENVTGSWIFEQPKSLSAELHLWRQFEFVQLKIVKRQAVNDPLRDILAALRVGVLLPHHIDILNTRLVHESNPNYETLQQECQNVLHIFPTLREVDAFNDLKNTELAKTTTVSKIRCIDKYADGQHAGSRAPDALVPNDDRKCAGIPRELDIGIGSRIMLRRNLNVEAGLANGSLATIERINWSINPNYQLEVGELPRSIMVRFDNKIPDTLLQNGLYTLTPKDFEYIGNRMNRLIRHQLPIIISYGTSCHKIQGATLQKAAISIGTTIFKPGMAYVMLSRVTSLNGLYILKLDPRKLIKQPKRQGPCNLKAFREMTRLLVISEFGYNADSDQELINDIINFAVDYPICTLCKEWVCVCKCYK